MRKKKEAGLMEFGRDEDEDRKREGERCSRVSYFGKQNYLFIRTVRKQ